MKILACLYGLVRTNLDSTIQNLKDQFSNFDIDFLISTWDDQIFEEEKFKYIIKNNPPTDEYLNTINFPYTRQIKNVPNFQHLRKGHYAQFYHNYRISEFLESNSIDYDILIKSRTDLVFETNFDFDFNKDICYIPEIYWASKGVGINDHFICGRFDYIKRAIKISKFEEFLPIIENSWNPETVNQNLILGNSCSYLEFPCYSYLLLPDRKMR
jgi:hypothetical protein